MTAIPKISVVCLGRLKEAYWRDACAEYQKRIGAFAKCTIIELEPERLGENPSPAQIEKALDKEGDRLLSKIPEGATVVALCIEGKTMSSEGLADVFRNAAVSGDSHLVFVIGSSFGLADKVKKAAAVRLSMSPMTFPHQMARVMLLEQCYRAAQIVSGGKYHK